MGDEYIKRDDALELYEMVLDSYKDSGTLNIELASVIADKELHVSGDDAIADFNLEIEGWRNDFKKIKSADVAPIRHGRWVDTNRYGFPVMECSECGAQTGTLNFPYCFNCGAKMDEEVSE